MFHKFVNASQMFLHFFAANVRGEAVQGSSGRGVGLSAAPCTCTSPNTCVCIRFYPRSQRVRRPAAKNKGRKESDEPRAVPALPMEFQDGSLT